MQEIDWGFGAPHLTVQLKRLGFEFIEGTKDAAFFEHCRFLLAMNVKGLITDKEARIIFQRIDEYLDTRIRPSEE